MNRIEKVRGNDLNLDVTMAFKMNSEKKEEYVAFALEHNLSMGKICREALDEYMENLMVEVNGVDNGNL